jgi:hypothetical protein
LLANYIFCVKKQGWFLIITETISRVNYTDKTDAYNRYNSHI